VAGGNLDIPLEMERHNLFGAFTESFDLMRAELKRARIAEAKANAAKKELVAKLSHDIKTPVASIKAASEVGAALAVDAKNRENYQQIVRKADQINTLVTNLFSATLEELQELSVTPSDMKSGELCTLLENADYLRRAALPEIPDCLLSADRLRLQEVFDNIFANSYKYAGTDIDVKAKLEERYLTVCVEDCGGGVTEEELPHLKEKFKRGGSVEGIEGAGLGLYISDHCMREMGGQLVLKNGTSGLRAEVWIALSRGV
jgi:signal transduction histidine kinase